MLDFKLGEDFFKDEERSGFEIGSLMKRCWGAQLQALEDFDRVCSRHGLKWFAFCGTLLGAVRHKGFIPWDDDLDVCMMRSDYNMFLRYAAKELPQYIIENYDYYNREERRHYDFQGITRINNSYNTNFDPEYLNTHCGFPYTIGLDLYPLDYVPKDPEEYNTAIQIFGFTINVGLKYKSLYWENYHAPEGNYQGIDLDEAYEMLHRATGFKIDKNGDVLRQLNEIALSISSYTKGKDADCVACMMHTAEGYMNMIFPKEAFSRTLEAPFESGSIYIPEGYDAVLSRNYGAGYLVPRNCSPHDYPYYRFQERWIREYILKNPDMKEFMPRFYISDVYDEDPDKKILLDKIYGKE